MPSIHLDQTRVQRLKPGRSAYDVRDRTLKGFGVRVLPSGGKRYFIHSQYRGRRVWKMIGEAEDIGVEEARSRAAALLAAIRHGEHAPAIPEETVFEAVAEEVFRRYGRNWKPRTVKVNWEYYRNQILPWFRGRQITEITGKDVQEWFAALHATPAAADRSAPILSVIMGQAEVYGYRPEDSNPCKGIRRYRRRGRERFLSAPELRRLAVVLDRHEADYPLHVSFIRLLLLTGCRKSEVLTLEWSCFREGKLFLRDSKTGPRTIWLSSAAKDVLNRLSRRTGWVFPSPRKDGFLSASAIGPFWQRVRVEAGLCDVRLHDLRHSYASIALMRGETVLTIGRLLGHNDPGTTLKYTHLADGVVREAAETVGSVLGEG